jgi:hemerythrin superfamily protein
LRKRKRIIEMMTMPVILNIEEVIASLERDHTEIKNALVDIKQAFQAKNTEKILELVSKIRKIVLEHVKIEEGEILKSLIETIGKEKSLGPIHTFRQHKVIEGALDQIESFAIVTPQELTPIVYDKFCGILSEHIASEDRYIFPFLIYSLSAKNKISQ